jgi:hypothetical protein
MPKAKQLTISVENRPGTLAHIARTLGDAKWTSRSKISYEVLLRQTDSLLECQPTFFRHEVVITVDARASNQTLSKAFNTKKSSRSATSIPHSPKPS